MADGMVRIHVRRELGFAFGRQLVSQLSKELSLLEVHGEHPGHRVMRQRLGDLTDLFMSLESGGGDEVVDLRGRADPEERPKKCTRVIVDIPLCDTTTRVTVDSSGASQTPAERSTEWAAWSG